MSKLFDEENVQHNKDEEMENKHFPEEEHEDVEIFPNRDKIFDNDYNTGNINFEEYSDLPRVDSFYAEDNLKDCYDVFEYSRKFNLEVLVDKYFKNTEYGKVFSSRKKIPKQVLPQVFLTIREQFVNNDYTGSEIFMCIADYFGVNYEIFYQNIPPIYRAELVKELDEKYDILSKKGLKKLF